MEPGGSMPHSQGDINILLLSSHLLLGFPKGIFPVGLPVKILKAFLPSSIMATCLAHLNLLDLITLTMLGERYKLWSSSLWNLLHSPFSSLLVLGSTNICIKNQCKPSVNVSTPILETESSVDYWFWFFRNGRHRARVLDAINNKMSFLPENWSSVSQYGTWQ